VTFKFRVNATATEPVLSRGSIRVRVQYNPPRRAPAKTVPTGDLLYILFTSELSGSPPSPSPRRRTRMTGPSALNFCSLDCRARLRPPQRRRLWLHSSTSCLVCALRPPLTEAQARAQAASGQQWVACHVAIGAVPNLNFTGKLKARGSKVLPVVIICGNNMW
jgi:hypothetical protein